MPKTAKTIFNTTEKSNFILNMTPESYQNYNLRILLGYLVLMPLFSMILEFAPVYSVPGMALSIIGVFAIVFVFIGFMKSETPKSLFLPAGLIGAMLAWGLVSLYNSYFYSISLFGSDGRNEGWLSLLFYGSFFLLGAQLGTDEKRMKFLHGLLYFGMVQCIWSFLQMLPIGFPSYYRNLEPLLIFRIFLPSGLTGNPIFLAILLNLLLIPAMLEAGFSENPKQKRFALICVFCFALTAIRTQCLIGYAGTICAVIFGLIQLFSRKAKAGSVTLAAILAILLGIGWNAVSLGINQSYSRATGESVEIENHLSLYDGSIIWKDSSYRLNVSGYYTSKKTENPNGSFDISDLKEVYHYLWKNTAKIIKKYPLAGSGPDSLVYPQLYQNRVIASNPNTFDRCYNYYLHMAGTLGILMLVIFLVLMTQVIRKGMQGVKQSESWLHVGFLNAVILYLIMMVIGSGSITTTPIFWMMAGICISLPKSE